MEKYAACLLVAFATVLVGSTSVQAAGLGQEFNFEGYLTDGSGNALPGPASSIQFQIYDPAQSCLLYDITYTSVPLSNGLFSIRVGNGGTRNTSADGGSSLAAIFQNDKAPRANGANCASGYNPSSGDGRKMKVTVNGTALSPLYDISPAPMATVAERLGGTASIASGALLLDPRGTSAGQTGELRMSELLANGSNTVSFRAPDSLAADVVYTLPIADGSNGQVLSTNGAGQLSWSTAGGGLPALTNNNLWVGNGSNNAMPVIPNGDVSMTNSANFSVLKIQGNAVAAGAPAAGHVLTWNAVASRWEGQPGGGGGGITSLNGLVTTTQSLATGTAGTTPSFNSTGSTHTLNIPMASTASVSGGLITNAEYTAFSNKLPNTLNNGQIFVGNVSNVGTPVTPNGDMSMDNSGLFTIEKIRGYTVASTAPTAGQVLKYNSANTSWEPSSLSAGGDFMANGSVAMTGSLQGAPGSSSSPSFAFSGSPNTGLFRPAANAVGFSTNGGERARIDSAGNVGIGTTGPTAKLDVKATGTGTVYPAIFKTDYANTGAGNSNNIKLDIINGNGSWSNGIEFAVNGAAKWYLTSDYQSSGQQNFAIYDAVGSQPRLLVNSAGQVGIGQATPGSTLDVKGTVRISGTTSGYVGFAVPAAAGSATYTWPAADGTSGYALTTNGSGTLAWSAITGTPTGTAGGDLSGNYPAPSVQKLQGRSVASFAPTNGQVLGWNNTTSTWEPRSSLPSLNNSSIWVGDAGNVPQPQTLSGDMMISNVGVGTVTGIRGYAVQSTPPANGQVLLWNNTFAQWRPTSLSLSSLQDAKINTGAQAMFVGPNAGAAYSSGGTFSTAFGDSALYSMTSSGSNNTAFGRNAGYNTTTGVSNTFVGASSGQSAMTTNGNTFVGNQSGYAATGDLNTFVGSNAGYSFTAGTNNVMIGANTGMTGATGSYNIVIGSQADVMASGTSNFMNLGNTLYGDLTTKRVGIGTSSPGFKIHVTDTNGAAKIYLENSSASGTNQSPQMQIASYSGSYSNPAILDLKAARGTAAAPNPVNTGDGLGRIAFEGRDTTGFSPSAAIDGIAEEGFSGAAHGTSLTFLTTMNGSTTMVPRMKIAHNGMVGIANNNPGAPLHVNGQIVSSAFSTSGSSMDMMAGNVQINSSVGGSAITLNNLVDGGKYTILITDLTSRTYTFSSCVNKFKPNNGATTASTQSIYEITFISGTCYINWSTGW